MDARHIVCIVLPSGYKTADEFVNDCGFELVGDGREHHEEIDRLRAEIERLKWAIQHAVDGLEGGVDRKTVSELLLIALQHP